MKRTLKSILCLAFVLLFGTMNAQTYSNDFENQYTWYQPWLNLHIEADSTSNTTNYVCICDSLHEYGLGVNLEAGKEYPRQSINCQYQFLFKAQADTEAEIVVSIDDETGNRYWNAYFLSDFVNDTAEWSLAHLDLNFPFDYISDGTIKVFVWNKGKERLLFDDAKLEIKPIEKPNYQPAIDYNADSVSFPNYFMNPSNFVPIVEYIDANGDTLTNPSVIETQFSASQFFLNPNEWENFESGKKLQIMAETRFKEDMKLLRLAYALPLPEGKITVYRRNQHIDSTNLQSAYYLDREGFSIESDTFSLYTYHNTNISSLQLDVKNRIACFNIDYWRDHPLIHYPLMSDTSDVFEDISYREIHKGETM